MLLKRFFLYGMPIYLLIIEITAKHLLNNEPVNYALSGPTIAVAGISLILPVLTTKPVPIPANSSSTMILINRTDQKLIELATIMFFLLVIPWVGSTYLAHEATTGVWAIVIGCLIYAVGVFLTGWKEKV